MLSIVHLADLHLGASYDSLPAEKATAAQESQLRVLQRAVDYANNQYASAILIAGDLFDQPTPPASLVTETFSILSRATSCVLIAPGNHDYLCADSPYLRAVRPEQVYVFTSTTLTAFPIGEQAVVWGAAFCDVSASIPLKAARAENRLNLCLVHSDLKTASGYNPLTPTELRASGFDYVAVGHNHSYSGVRRAGHTIYACPGSPMGVGLDDMGPKGFLFGELSDQAKFRFVPGGGIEFHEYKIDFSTLADDRAFEQAIRVQIPKNHAKVCANLALCGERSYEPNLPSLRHALEDVFFHHSISDETMMRRDLWRYLTDDDLRGGVSRRYHAMLSAASSEEEKQRLTLSLRYALAALDGEQPPAWTAGEHNANEKPRL